MAFFDFFSFSDAFLILFVTIPAMVSALSGRKAALGTLAQNRHAPGLLSSRLPQASEFL